MALRLGSATPTALRVGSSAVSRAYLGSTEVFSAAAPTFDPTTIPNLAAWYDASTLTGLSDGDIVQTWPDLSGNGRDLSSATSSHRPTYKPAEVAGKPALRFDGVDDWMGWQGTSLTGTTYTLFVVDKAWSITGFGNDPNFFAAWTVGATSYRNNGAAGNPAMWGGSVVIQATGKGYDLLRHVRTDLFQGTASTLRLDGAQVAAGNIGSSNLADGGFVVSRRSGSLSQSYIKSAIPEVLLYARALTTSERDQVEAYLLAKYPA